MHYTTWLRWVLLIGLSLVFFIPFIIADGSLLPNMFFPFITGKNFAFRLLIEVLLGVYVLLAVREPKYRPKISYLMWAVGAFVLWMAVATTLSVDPVKSFWSNFERMEGYLTVLHLFVYFLMVGAVVTAEDWWGRLLQVSVISSVIMGCYAVLQLMGKIAISSQSGVRVDTTFGNATYLAVFMLFNAFITMFLLVRHRRSTLAQMLYGIALALELVTLYYTQTRGSMLGFLGGLAVAALFIAWRGTAPEWKLLRKVSLWGLGAVAVLVLAFIGLRNTSFVQHSSTLQRFASISLADRTTIARFQIWHMALEGFTEKPVLGWGQENFSFVFNKYYEPSMYVQEQWFDRAHNQFLDWLIAGGLPAFALYVSFFLLAAWVVFKSEVLEVPEKAVLFGLLAGYAFNNLFVFDDLMSSVYFFLILAFVHGLSQHKLPRWMAFTRPAHDRVIAVIAPVVVVVVAVGAWSLNAPGIARAQNLLNAIMTVEPVSDGQGHIVGGQKDPKKNIEQFKVALGPNVWPGTPMGEQEVMEQLLQYASGMAASTSVDPSVKQDTAALAESVGIAMNKSRPHDARLELFLGAFYDTYQHFPQAIDYLNQALKDSPNKQQIMFELGVVHLNSNDAQGSLPIFKKAFDSAPEYNDARILYAAGLYYAGNKQAADDLLTQGFGTVLVDDARMLQVYINTKQFDRVVGIWQNRVKAAPNDAQKHVGLAAAYYAAGNKAGAISELQRAGQLDASIAPQVQSYITQIQNGTLK